jgi:hypothetical protein
VAEVTYDKQLTALLVIDPYNDFISEGGKIWDRLKDVAEANKCVSHMMQVLDARIRRLSGIDRNHSGGRSGTWSQRSRQHVANDSRPDEHPEHHVEPSAAAALAQR